MNHCEMNLSKARIAIIVIVAIILLAAILAPTIYFTTRGSGEDAPKAATKPPVKDREHTQDDMLRVDCYPERISPLEHVTKVLCEKRGCIYDANSHPNVSPCYHYVKDTGYKVYGNQESTAFGFRLFLKRKGTGPYPNDLTDIIFEVEKRSDTMLRFKFDVASGERYRVPLDLALPTGGATDNVKYDFKITSYDPFSFQIIRKETGAILWDTSVGGLVFANQFLQIATKLSSIYIYGFGENMHPTFRHNLDYKTHPMFSRDQPPSPNNNLYGVHPFYTCLEVDGNSHGVFLLNSNAQDYSFTPAPMLTYRTIGGILDFYVFLGPEPENVIQQYTQVIGRPFMPPYWSLGFQLSKYGYNSLENLKAALNRTKQYNIPVDVQYVDIDHMSDSMDFTIDQVNFDGLPEYLQSLRDDGMRTIIILDPCLISNVSGYEPYERMRDADANIHWPENYTAPPGSRDVNNAVLGYVWPTGKVVLPDFFKNKTREIWIDLITKHRKTLPFDGLWIDMNEPANFGTNEERPWNWPEDVKPYWSLQCPEHPLEDPPYKTMAVYAYEYEGSSKRGRLSDKTMCMTARQGEHDELSHYDVHSLYGWSQTMPTLQAARAATGERSVVITRSTYPGSGKYAGHWLGDNSSKWKSMAESIIGMLEFSLFGIPYIGADVCGYFDVATPELCKRWMQLGAFYPFFRNHNGLFMDQDPGMFGPEVAQVAFMAVETRYYLLPYLYTLFYHAHTRGDTVVRPLFHEFPHDTAARSIDTQFMWGPALLISPILHENIESMTAYLPAARWIDLYTFMNVTDNSARNLNITIDRLSPIPLHLRGGHIIPMQEVDHNTHFSRRRPFTITVVLDNPEYGGNAYGELFWDDGSSIDTIKNGAYFFAKFICSRNLLEMEIQHNGYDVSNLTIANIDVYGVYSDVQYVRVNSRNIDFTHNPDTKLLKTVNLTSLLNLGEEFSFAWSSEPHEEASRIDCYPESADASPQIMLTREVCRNRGCLFESTLTPNVPWCYFMQHSYGYEVAGNSMYTPYGFKVPLRRIGKSPYSKDVADIMFEIEMRDEKMLRFKFDSPGRYKVPVPLHLPSTKATTVDYHFYITNSQIFSFQIIRKSTGTVLWDTGVGGLTFADQFLQIATRLPSSYIYGFGENLHKSFRHDLNFKSWPMFARDQAPSWKPGSNLYGVHPFYMCMEEDGNAHGVLFFNSNAQDYTLSPLPMLTYRAIGGILDFFVFLGPDPESVIQQYTKLIGRPYMPPYWSLGFQLCRYGYNSLENLKAAVNRTKDHNIPHDVQYADIDHMDERKDFTVDPVNFAGLKEYFEELRGDGMHTIVILDPCLISNVSGYEPYEMMLRSDATVTWPDDVEVPADSSDSVNSILGFVWPKGKVVLPDFFQSSAADSWINLTVSHHKNDLKFDGIWIDMNEPANFGTNLDRPWNWPEKDTPYWSLKCPTSKYDDPDYRTQAGFVHGSRISDKTICMVARQGKNREYRHYDVHSLYGWSQTLPTLHAARAATGRRSIVISRSTFPGSGQHAGHWLGDNESRWSNLHESIIGMLEFNLFGIPYIGADICGFFLNTNAELCKRWMQLGAFYPFSRNHNGIGNMAQDPGALGDDVANASRVAVKTRYWLLPYLYTLFYHAHTEGHTVVRPLHHEFPLDKVAYDVDRQFLWGSALLISPILDQGATVVNAYFPNSRWYNLYTGNVTSLGANVEIPVNENSSIPLHVRGGFILPTQTPANNTVHSRRNPMGLIVAPDENGQATGDLFWDDGDSIDTILNDEYALLQFDLIAQNITLTIIHSRLGLMNDLVLDTVRVFGVSSAVQTVSHGSFTYDSNNQVLGIMGMSLSLEVPVSITWT